MSLTLVPDAGVDLTLGTWYYAGKGNLVELSITGVTKNGGLNEIIRDASQPVTESEAKEGIKAKLQRSILEKLDMDSNFTLHARMSFDGGAHYFSFPNQSVQIVP
ncbi:hypothetical protein ACYU03_07885 [Pseudomonas sp. X10]